MPNLEAQAVQAWLAEWHPDTGFDWPPAIRPMEAESKVAFRLEQFGGVLDKAALNDTPELSRTMADTRLASDLGAVLAQLGAARCVRLLHWMTEQELPDSPVILSALLQSQNTSSHALRGLLAGLRRRSVLERIFAPDRLAALETACLDTFAEDALP